MGSFYDFSILDTSDEAITTIVRDIENAFVCNFVPPPKLNLVEWADTYRYLPDNSAEPGRWETMRVPPAVEVYLSISNPDVKEVTIMSCIQLMKTEAMINTALFFVHQEPSPIMYVAPKKEIAEAWSKERFVKSVNATPVLKGIFSDNRRDQGNTILQKQFPGGQLSIVSARNPDDLAMRACRIMLFDECDKYPSNVGAGDGGSGGEGDPIAVAWGRATTYGERAKKITACSPTVQGKSRIEQEYLAGDQRTYHMPCPNCNHNKEILWADVIIPVDKTTGEYMTDDAHILCSECGHKWTEGERLESVEKGVWVAKYPERKKHHSYKVSSICSPFTPVVTLAEEYVKAFGNPELLKAFNNTRLAITWREEGEQPDWELMYERRKDYTIGVVPQGGLLLTMGIDVQKDGVYFETVAWGRRKQSWSVEAGFEAGDIEEEEFRTLLKDKYFNRIYKNYLGVNMDVEKICIDSGYKTQAVYSLVREFFSERVVAVKGKDADSVTTILGTPTPVDVNINGERISRGLKLWNVGSSVIKEQLYNWFNLKPPTDEALKAGKLYPTGYCNFPMYDEEYFKQITAEQRMLTINKKGFESYAWEKLRKDNHYLDCRVYARAGAAMMQLDRMRDEDWNERAKYFEGTVDKVEIDSTTQMRDTSNTVNRRKSTWLNRNR